MRVRVPTVANRSSPARALYAGRDCEWIGTVTTDGEYRPLDAEWPARESRNGTLLETG